MTSTYDWPELRRRCARCGMEDHTIEDCHAWCSHPPDQPCTRSEPVTRQMNPERVATMFEGKRAADALAADRELSAIPEEIRHRRFEA